MFANVLIHHPQLCDLLHGKADAGWLQCGDTPFPIAIMIKFLSCGLIAALAIIPTAVRVCAEPPPMEPVVVSSEQVPSTDNTTQVSEAK